MKHLSPSPLRAACLACCFVLAMPPLPTPAADPPVADAFASLQRDGKPYKTFYNNFIAPHAVLENGIVFTAHQDGEGRPVIDAYNIEQETWLGPVRASEFGLGKDTHGNPSLCIDAKGHLHVFFGCHSHPMKHIRSKRPYDIRAWEKMSSPFEPATYPQSMRMADGRLFLFCRNARGHLGPWSLKISEDDGKTWSGPEPVVDMRHHFPDKKACSYNAFVPGANGDTVHCFWVHKDDNPRGNRRKYQDLHEAVYRYNIYYAKRTTDGKWIAADGTPMDDDRPVNKTFSDSHAMLHDTGESFAKPRRIVIGPDDTPYLRFGVGVDDWKHGKVLVPETKHFVSPANGKWKVHDRMPADWPKLVQRLLMSPGPAAFGGDHQPNQWFIHFREGPDEDPSATYVWLGHIDLGYATRPGGPAKAP